MVFLLKQKNKISKKKSEIKKLENFRSILTKVKYVAKNVIYLNGWSNQNLDKKLNYTSFEDKIDFSFKNYLVKIVREPDPLVLKSKELRCRIFFGDKNPKLDSDKFDSLCEHLVVIDTSVAHNFVVGSYRLLFKPKHIEKTSFYSESEFNLKKLLKVKKISLLEAGRSCVHKNYRDGTIIKLLWRGLASYIKSRNVDFIFGCASFPSSNPELFDTELSYLGCNHKPPKKFNTKPLSHLQAKFNKVEKKYYNNESVFRTLPPLIKAYIRAGAWIGEGAVCDYKFNTTDVLVILKSNNIIKKYSNLSIKT